MKIAVTGSLGHIGSYIIRDLGIQFPGAEIIMIDNLMTQRWPSLFNLPKVGNYKFIDKDVTKTDTLDTVDTDTHNVVDTDNYIEIPDYSGVSGNNIQCGFDTKIDIQKFCDETSECKGFSYTEGEANNNCA